MYHLTNISSHSFGRDTYVLDIHRTSAGLAAISSNQHLTLHDPSRLEAGPLRSLKTNHGNLTTLEVFDRNAALVCTAGENGKVGVWDLRQGVSVAQFTGTLGVVV
jgi:WD repeat-containing protein 89